ncbi:hypothetical protein ACTA71_001035 [Dictyostelium dimigraforme]
MEEVNCEIKFFKVWRNIYLKYLILNECSLYKENRNKYYSSVKKFKECKFRNYVENVTIKQKENDYIQEGDLPNNGVLKKVHIMNGQFKSSIIPNGVLSVTYPNSPCSYSNDLKGLPPSVNSLENVSIEDYSCIPESITSIKFNPIRSILNETPLSIDNTNENKDENNIYRKKLSDNLKTLLFGYSWDNNKSKLNQGDLPCNLLTLDLGAYNNVFEKGILPNSITNLVAPYNNFILKKEVLPNSLKSLILRSQVKEKDIFINFNNEVWFPNEIEILKVYLVGYQVIEFQDYILPKSLKSLDIGSLQEIKYSGESLVHLHQLQSISLGDFWGNLNDFHLPNSGSLTKVDFGNKFNQIIENGVLPNSIRVLKFGVLYNKPFLMGSLPESLEELYFALFFNQPILPNHLPSTLKILNLPNYFNQPLYVGSLPRSLKKLKIGLNNGYSDFNQPILKDVLPDSLEELHLNSRDYQHVLDLNILPSSLLTLKLPSTNVFKDLNNDFINNLSNSIKLFQ